jgi:hypothetical protein
MKLARRFDHLNISEQQRHLLDFRQLQSASVAHCEVSAVIGGLGVGQLPICMR